LRTSRSETAGPLTCLRAADSTYLAGAGTYAFGFIGKRVRRIRVWADESLLNPAVTPLCLLLLQPPPLGR